MDATSRSRTTTFWTTIRQSSSGRAGEAADDRVRQREDPRPVGVERPDPVAVGQFRECRARRVSLGLVLGIIEVAPGMLLLELLEPGKEARMLTTGDRQLRGLEAPAQLSARHLDDLGRQDSAGDRRKDMLLDEIGRAAPGATADRRAAIVAALAPALHVRLAAHPRRARAVDETAERVGHGPEADKIAGRLARTESLAVHTRPRRSHPPPSFLTCGGGQTDNRCPFRDAEPYTTKWSAVTGQPFAHGTHSASPDSPPAGFPIDVASVSKTYSTRAGSLEALRSATFSIRPGEFVSLVGPSGCGKSTLLKLIGGLVPPTEGEMRIAGDTVASPRRDVGMLFQSPVLFPWRDVLENVLIPAEIFGLDPAAARAKALDMLRLVGLDGFEHAYPRELSGGMQQRVTISRVLLTDPHVILMDEPFGALDEFTRERLNIELLRIWHERRQTIVFVTHNVQEAVFLSDRVVVMGTRPGSVIAVIDVRLPRPRATATMREAAFSSTVFRIRELLGVDEASEA